MNADAIGVQPIEAVLFDIDGTLITTGGAGAVAWDRAFRELYDKPADIDEFAHAGMTDPEVGRMTFTGVMGREPSKKELASVMARRQHYLTETVVESKDYRVMDGVEETLTRLVEAGTLLGLTTGNVETAAHTKLSRANLNRFFSFGGYGSDSTDRVELTKRGVERGIVVAGGSLRKEECISVGDTPLDVSAGHGAGIRVVGVATGDFTVEQLRDVGADWAIPSLDDGFPV
jgi:phosphoglycolate phosphatase-like HAD superfamily hydrolase